jgi:hypothetical protein
MLHSVINKCAELLHVICIFVCVLCNMCVCCVCHLLSHHQCVVGQSEPATHQRTIHRMLILTQLWMNLN